MRGKVVIVDGISNSGKTTLCRHLLSENNILVEDDSSFAEKYGNKYGIDRLPDTSRTLGEEKRNQNLILNIEIDRLKDALVITAHGQNAILDGSFLSYVARSYSYERSKMLPGSYENSIQLLKFYLNKIDEMFENGDVSFVFFDVNQDNFAERNSKRKMPLTGNSTDERLVNLQRQFFMVTSLEFKSELIDTSDLTVEEIDNIVRSRMGGMSI